MRSALLVLAMPRCRDASRNATLGVVESLLDLEGGLGYNIIMGHVDQLLESLRLIALTAWATPVSHSVPFIPTGTSSPPCIQPTCRDVLHLGCTPSCNLL